MCKCPPTMKYHALNCKVNEQDRLLSDNELQEAFGRLIERFRNSCNGNEDEYYQDDLNNDIFDLVETQKRLYAEGVVGEDELEGVSDATHNVYAGAEYRNQLRAEQRARIK